MQKQSVAMASAMLSLSQDMTQSLGKEEQITRVETWVCRLAKWSPKRPKDGLKAKVGILVKFVTSFYLTKFHHIHWKGAKFNRQKFTLMTNVTNP